MLEFGNPMACPACGVALVLEWHPKAIETGRKVGICVCDQCGSISALERDPPMRLRPLTSAERSGLKTRPNAQFIREMHDLVVARLWG